MEQASPDHRGSAGRGGGAETGQRGELKRRFFVAVMPPADHTETIDKLRHYGPANWDWKRHGDYHISLAFPGMLDTGEVGRLIKALHTVEQAPFDLNFEGLGYFLKDPFKRSRGAQNVLWARPDGPADNALRSLHNRIAAALKDHKFAHGINDISPHLTVAKVPGNENTLMEQFAAAHGHTRTSAWRCDRFGLYETLPPGDPRHPDNNEGRGSRYVKIAEFTLKTPAA
jgi:2'-5' RNA ligase